MPWKSGHRVKCAAAASSDEFDVTYAEFAFEAEDFATFTKRMKACSVSELRKACRLFKLSDKGSKLEMIARLHAHAQEQNNMDVGDSQEEDEEEEEEKKKNLPPPKASPKCKKAASPGPVKTIAKTRKAGAKARK